MFKKITFVADVRLRLIEFLELKKNWISGKGLFVLPKVKQSTCFPHNGFIMLDTKLKSISWEFWSQLTPWRPCKVAQLCHLFFVVHIQPQIERKHIVPFDDG